MTWILAWRNLWRNPRRTGIILAAVIMGVWLMLFMGAYSRGMLVDMIDNSINTLTGHLQVHAPGYLDDPGPERALVADSTFAASLDRALPTGSKWAPRVRLETVAATARHSGSVTLRGVDFDRERGVSFLPDALEAGVGFPGPDDPDGIIVGAALLDVYDAKVGHKLILTARDASGEVQSRAFQIRGVYHASLPATEKQYAFVRLESAQAFFGLGNAVSEVSIMMPTMDDPDTAATALRAQLPGDRFQIDTWRDLLPAIRGYLDIWDIYMAIWNLIVFVAMGFGLTNTLLMAVYERMREFGLVRAIGMKPRQVLSGVLLEAVLLLAVGLAAGNLLNWLAVAVLSRTGIDMSAFAEGAEYFGVSRVIRPVLSWKDFISANGMTIVLGLLVSIYPAWRAGHVPPVEAIAKAT